MPVRYLSFPHSILPLVFFPPLHFRLSDLLPPLPHRQDIIPENTAISLCTLPPSTVSPFAQSDPFYRHTHRLAFKTYLRTSSVFLSAHPTFAKKLRVGEESYAPTSKRASKSKLADKEVIDCVVSPKGKVRDALQGCKASSSCPAPPFPANRARSDITENPFGNSPALLRFTKPPKQHYSNKSCSESEYYYGL